MRTGSKNCSCLGRQKVSSFELLTSKIVFTILIFGNFAIASATEGVINKRSDKNGNVFVRQWDTNGNLVLDDFYSAYDLADTRKRSLYQGNPYLTDGDFALAIEKVGKSINYNAPLVGAPAPLAEPEAIFRGPAVTITKNADGGLTAKGLSTSGKNLVVTVSPTGFANGLSELEKHFPEFQLTEGRRDELLAWSSNTNREYKAKKAEEKAHKAASRPEQKATSPEGTPKTAATAKPKVTTDATISAQPTEAEKKRWAKRASSRAEHPESRAYDQKAYQDGDLELKRMLEWSATLEKDPNKPEDPDYDAVKKWRQDFVRDYRLSSNTSESKKPLPGIVEARSQREAKESFASLASMVRGAYTSAKVVVGDAVSKIKTESAEAAARKEKESSERLALAQKRASEYLAMQESETRLGRRENAVPSAEELKVVHDEDPVGYALMMAEYKKLRDADTERYKHVPDAFQFERTKRNIGDEVVASLTSSGATRQSIPVKELEVPSDPVELSEEHKKRIQAVALLGGINEEARIHEESKIDDAKVAEIRQAARLGKFGPDVRDLAVNFDSKVASGEIKLNDSSEPKVADAKAPQSSRVPEKVDESVTKVAQALKEKREALGNLRVQKAAEAKIKQAEDEALALEQQLSSMKTKENRREIANLILDAKAAERKIIMTSGTPAPKQQDPRAKPSTKEDAAYQKYKAHFQRLREQENLPNEQEAGYMGGIVQDELDAERKRIAGDPVLKAAFEKAEGEYQVEKKKTEEDAVKTAEAEKKRAVAEEKVTSLKKLKEAEEKRKKLKAEGAEYWEEGQQNQEIRRLERKTNVSAKDADSALSTASKELAELGGAKTTAGKVDASGSSTSVSQTPGTTAPPPPAPPAAPELTPKEKAAKALADAKAERERVAKEFEEKRTKAIGEQKEKVASASKRDEDRIKNLQGDGKKKFNQVDAVPVSTCKRDDAGNEVGGSYQYTNLRIFMDSEIKSREAMDFRECINQHVLHAATTVNPAELKKDACDATATQESKLPPKVLATREYGRRLFQYVKGIQIVKSANATAVASPVLDDRGVLVIEVDDSGEKSGQHAFKKGDAKGKEVIEYSMKAQKSKSEEDKMGYKKASMCQKLEGEKGLFAMLDNYGNRALAAAPKQEEEKLMAGALKDLAEAKKSAEATERAAEASWNALQADGTSSPKSTVVASGGPGAADPNAGNATK